MMTQNAIRHTNKHYNRLSHYTMMIASGTRLYSAKVDPAGTAMYGSLRSDITSLEIKIREAARSIDAIGNDLVSQEAKSEILINLQTMAEQIATGTYSDDQKEIIADQFNEFVEQLGFVDNLAKEIAFGDSKLLKIASEHISPEDLLSDPDAVMEELKNLINTNSAAAAALGTDISRLDSRIDWMQNYKLNLEEAASRIADVDMATAMAEYTNELVMSQVATAMIAQSNNINRDIVLSLLDTLEN
jgi:flagellin